MKPWEGWLEGAAGRVMAVSNRDMEQAVVDRLAPAPDAAVLALGFGPGVGIELLCQHITAGRVAGADPSATMCRLARRRNRHAAASGRLCLVQAPADALPFPAASFDAVVAVNTAQFFEPPGPSVAEIARVSLPGARFVTLTHDWAVRRHARTTADWLNTFAAALGCHGFDRFERWTAGRARSGGTVGFEAWRRA